MYDRILVPTDGSPEVEGALEYAFELAQTHDATVRGLYVVNAAGYGGLPMETAWEGITDALHADGQTAVERVEDLAPPDVSIETTVLEGSPSRAIVDEADAANCDLIVMGTHGRGGIDRLLLGSVTERVVRCSTVPVLTVRVETETEVTTQDASSRVAIE
ncbi:universal stress protein [Salinadaptatus halalkaliphilus]|uniref:Universal stress protein n=1 Tax=Salinadaptatus halalkaliphilus TaxID=2419781 RepID=A0A4S3TRZ2_9EURY|nr:universal stress protein [Salinadaptatus halalkaliphilus]THE65388.1 universal stress protein [Salinadaptatus halalkaliphilus]